LLPDGSVLELPPQKESTAVAGELNMPVQDELNPRYGDAAYAHGRGEFVEAFAGFSDLLGSRHAKAAAYLAQMYLRG
jgi:hypothetical protein